VATVRLYRSTTAGNVPASLVSGQVAINEADGKLFYRNGSGVVTQLATGGSGGTELYTYATTANFPGTGVTTALYLSIDSGKVFQWTGSVYAEVGPVGGGAFPATVTIPGLGDSYYDNVSLLLHGNGNLTDTSGTPKTVTAVGSAATSTTQKRFGTASLASLAASDFYTVPDSSAFDFGSGDFTVECWLYPVSGNAGYRTIFGKRLDGSVVAPLMAFIDPSGQLSVFAANAASAGSTAWTFQINASSSPSVGQWSHFAMVRSGTTVTVWLNGASVGTSTALGTSALVTNSAAFTVGSTTNSVSTDPYFGGYIDEFRVTKGIARFTSAFTPSATAYPDGSGITVPVVYT